MDIKKNADNWNHWDTTYSKEKKVTIHVWRRCASSGSTSHWSDGHNVGTKRVFPLYGFCSVLLDCTVGWIVCDTHYTNDFF